MKNEFAKVKTESSQAKSQFPSRRLLFKFIKSRAETHMGKHVIFLGAGASHASGYPLASQLRLLLSSKKHFQEWIQKCFSGDGNALGLATEFFDAFEKSIKLFREGGFATVDEFCKLSNGKPSMDGVEGMRYLTRVVLGALNPEENFEKSEYYSFIQKLFENDLANLRKDISILSFNYDPYLEFLIYRAWERRNGKKLPVDLGNSITSGFRKNDSQNWADLGQPNFYLLKLHGSICDFDGQNITAHLLFSGTSSDKKSAIFSQDMTYTPPIVFPWEVLNEDLTFRDHNFPIQNRPDNVVLFKRIWERAAKEVLSAEKISFVGLSMHPYLELGFQYIFQGKAGSVQVVVANTLNERFKESHRQLEALHPNSPCRKVFDMLNKVSNGKLTCEYSDREPKTIRSRPDNGGQKITPRYSFADFIEHEL